MSNAWWRGSSDERYDYLYSTAELASIAERVKHRTGVLYANNHPNAKSVATALTLKRMLEQTTGPAPPGEMNALYPSLTTIR